MCQRPALGPSLRKRLAPDILDRARGLSSFSVCGGREEDRCTGRGAQKRPAVEHKSMERLLDLRSHSNLLSFAHHNAGGRRPDYVTAANALRRHPLSLSYAILPEA